MSAGSRATAAVVATLSILAVIAAAANLQTIRSFPSWFDEAFFANIAFNAAQGRGLVSDLIPGYATGPVLMYGPVYFALQALLIQLFSLDALVFRLPNLLAGYASCALIVKTLRGNGLSRMYCGLLGISLVVDVSINRNLVSGRMDMVAVMFVAAALYAAARPASPDSRADLWRGLLVGALSAMAFLTTPRAMFLLPVVAAAAFHTLAGHRAKWGWLASAAAAFALPVALWVAKAGGPAAYLTLMSASQAKGNFISPSFFRSSYDNIAIALMICLVLLNFGRVRAHALIAGLVLTYLAFSLFVNEVGPYAGMIMPFVLGAVHLVLAGARYPMPVKAGIVLLVTVPGALLLGLRGIDAWANADCRDGAAVRARIDSLAGAHAKIVAPFKYYFLAERETRDVVAPDYSRAPAADIVRNATLVITGGAVLDEARAAGLSHGGEFSCNQRKIPLLPETFNQRSIFNESLLKTPS